MTEEIKEIQSFTNNDVAAFDFDESRLLIRQREREILGAKDKEDKHQLVSLGRVQWASKAETQYTQTLWDFKACGIPYVWTHYGVRGAGANVHVLDTGIDMRHSAFAHRPVTTKSFVPSYRGDSDGEGHGTWVAGKIGGAGIGLAPDCNLYTHKVLDDSGSGRISFTNDALEWILDQKTTPHVINMSLGGSWPSARMDKALWRLYQRGVLIIVAAGNEGDDNKCYPAHSSGVVAVAAVNRNKVRANFSNYGANIDIAAPGVACYSSFPSESFRLLQGTSMATPTVAGLITLGVSYALKRGHAEGPALRDIIMKSLENSAEDLGPAGKDPYYGFGCIDGKKFMERLHNHL
jgi:subtilisin family serine protease